MDNEQWLEGMRLVATAIAKARRDNENWLCWQDIDGSTKIGIADAENRNAAELASWPDRTVILVEKGSGNFFYRGPVMRGPAAMVEALAKAK